MSNRLLNTRQVCKILGMELNAVYDYIKSSGLKAHKLGGNDKSKRHWRIWEQDLETFINGAELEHGRHIEEDFSNSEQVADSAPTNKRKEIDDTELVRKNKRNQKYWGGK